MVITLLETCGHYFGRGSSKKRLDRFLVHFQRYILSKGPLPLDIEFDLQDLFANLRPNMTRYMSINEVNAAILQLEEHEHASTEKASLEKHADSEKRPSMSSSNIISANGAGENGEAHEDMMGESDSDSCNGSLGADGHDEVLDEGNQDRGSESDDGDDYDDGDGPASDDDDVDDDKFRVRQKVVAVDPEEEADFDQELKAMLQESMEQRKQELRGRPALNMTIPMNVFESSGKDHHHGRISDIGDEASLGEESGKEQHKDVQVKVLVKRGNKQQTRQMLIPRDCSLIQSTKQKEAAELEEKQDIKRLVLEYNDRDEEEANGLGNHSLNRTLGLGRSGGGSRYRYYYHQGGGGSYHTRRK